MTTVLVTIAATWAAVILIAAVIDPGVREGLAGVLLSPALIVVPAAVRLVYPRFLLAGPRRLEPGWAPDKDVQATVIVGSRRRVLVCLTPPTTQDGGDR